MTTTARALTAIRNAAPSLAPLGGGFGLSSGSINGSYQSSVRNGYAHNEIIAAAMNLRANSAAEPAIIGRRYKDVNSRRIARQQTNYLRATGMPLWAIKEVLNRQQVQEDLDERQHPLVDLLNHPNPFMSRYRLYSTFIMDHDLAGNAYLLKARDTLFNSTPLELWRLRPDRVRIQTDGHGAVSGYEYRVGQESIVYPKEDIIHWKTMNPLDDHYGMPPLMPLSRRLDIDNFMTDFVSAFFQNGAQPGGMISVKAKMTPEKVKEMQERINRRFGPGNWFETMVLDQNEATFTPMTSPLGTRGIVMPELNAITEARIAMLFGIPPSILNLLVGLEKSSYANQRQDWQILWDVTLAPLYSDLDDQLTLSLVPEFKTVRGGIDEVLFDLSDVKALQEDVDKLHDRARRNVAAGIWPVEYAAVMTGVDLTTSSGTLLIPANYVPTPVGDLGKPMTDPRHIPPSQPAQNLALMQAAQIVDEAFCPDCRKFLGRNVNEGAELWCKSCKAEKVVAG